MISDTSEKPRTGNTLAPFMPRKYTMHHLACLHACIDQLGMTLDTAWVYGVTGYAFMINVTRQAMVAGPTCWDFQRVFERTPGFGIDCSDFVYSRKEASDFPQKQQEAIALAKRCCDAGIPAYGAQFGYPEYFTIEGYNDKGLLGNSWCFRDSQGEAKPQLFPWESLGVVDVGVLFVGAVKQAGNAPDLMKTIAETLQFALVVGHAEQGYLGGDAVGLRAYDAWIDKIQEELAKEGQVSHPNGADHNTECWWECRLYAPQFLRQVSEKTSGDVSRQFARAAEQYDRVLEAMNEVRNLCHYYMPREEQTREVLAQTVKHLRAAREAESKGLDMLAAISKVL